LILADGTAIRYTFGETVYLPGDAGSFSEMPYNRALEYSAFEVWCQTFQFGSPRLGKTTARAAAPYTVTIERPSTQEQDTVVKNVDQVVPQTSHVLYDASRGWHALNPDDFRARANWRADHRSGS